MTACVFCRWNLQKDLKILILKVSLFVFCAISYSVLNTKIYIPPSFCVQIVKFFSLEKTKKQTFFSLFFSTTILYILLLKRLNYYLGKILNAEFLW